MNRVARVAAWRQVKREFGLASGYRISDRLVLTAAHVLEDATTVEVDLGGDTNYRPVRCVWQDERADLALLQFEEAPESSVPPVRLGRVDTSRWQRPLPVGALAYGYPRSTHIREANGDGPDDGWRGRADVPCTIRTGATGAPGTGRVSLDWAPAAVPRGSPWKGMSGAAVITRQPALLVAVFREHAPETGVSRHEVTFLDSIDDEEWRKQLRCEGVDPEPWPVFPDAWDVTGGSGGLRPHLEHEAELAQRRPFLLPGQLRFVDPGEHPASPSGVLGRLTALADDSSSPVGVAVTGIPGAGKTRLCLETAALADRHHWQVLHLTGQVSLTAAWESVRGLCDRVLLVADELSSLGGTPETEVREVRAQAAARDVKLAVLAGARPEAWKQLNTQPLLPAATFETVTIRSDRAHFSAIRRQVLDSLAQDAVEQKGERYLAERCTGPPAITVFAARYYNREAEKGHDLNGVVPIREGDLGAWLREVLSSSGFRAQEPFDPGGEQGGELLNVARIFACLPWSRAALGSLLVPGAGSEDDARRSRVDQLTGRLAGQGFLYEWQGQLRLEHDLYGDQLLGQVLLNPGWEGVREAALHEVLATGFRDARALVHVATAVDRLRGALDDAQGDKLAGAVTAWCQEHLDALGTLLLDDPKGEGRLLRALLALPTWRAVLQGSVRRLVGPWLREHYHKAKARDALLEVAHSLPPDIGHAYLMAWLRTNTHHPRAAFVIRRALTLEGLAPESGEWTADQAYEYLTQHAHRREASHALTQLLDTGKGFGLPPGDPRAPKVVTWADQWLRQHGDTPEAGFVARPLMLRPELQGERLARTARLLLETIALREPREASFAWEPVLHRHRLSGDLPEPVFKHAVAEALAWLEADHGYGMLPGAAYVLKELITPKLPGRDLLPRAVEAGWNWLTANSDLPAECELVLPKLLRNARKSPRGGHAALTPDERADLGRITVRWLAETNHRQAGRHVQVLGELLRTRLLDDDHELLHQHIEWALALVREAPDTTTARDLLPPSLAKQVLAPGTRERLMARVSDLLADHPTDVHTAYTLTDLLRRQDLSTDEYDQAIGATLRWLDARGRKPGALKLLRTAFVSPRATAGQRGRLADRAVAMLSVRILAPVGDEPALTSTLLQRRAAIPAEWNRYVARACGVVERAGLPGGTMKALKTMLQGADQLDTLVRRQLHQVCVRWCEVNDRSPRAFSLLTLVLESPAVSSAVRSRATREGCRRLGQRIERKQPTGALLVALLRDGDLRDAHEVGHALDVALDWLDGGWGKDPAVLPLLHQMTHRWEQGAAEGSSGAAAGRALESLDGWVRRIPRLDEESRAAAGELRHRLAALCGAPEEA